MSGKHIPKRSPNQTRLSFSLSKDLRKKLEIEAARQKRTLSNLISVLLEDCFSETHVAEEPNTIPKTASSPHKVSPESPQTKIRYTRRQK